MNQCTNCGAALDPGATVCPSCGTPVAAAPGVTAQAASGGASAATAGTSVSTLWNLARGAKGIALLGFLLPWVTFSCAGTPFARVSGLQLATGNLGDIGANAPGGAAATPQDYSADYFVLAAALLIVIGLVVTFVLPRRKAALAAMAACAIALVLIVFDVFVRIKGAAEDQMRQSMAASAPTSAPSNPFEAQMRQQMDQVVQGFSVDPAIGFWLTALCLIAAIVLLKMVHGKTT
jgi:hypothetical protein